MITSKYANTWRALAGAYGFGFPCNRNDRLYSVSQVDLSLTRA